MQLLTAPSARELVWIDYLLPLVFPGRQKGYLKPSWFIYPISESFTGFWYFLIYSHKRARLFYGRALLSVFQLTFDERYALRDLLYGSAAFILDYEVFGSLLFGFLDQACNVDVARSQDYVRFHITMTID